MENKIYARVIHLHDTEDNWKLCPQFVPQKSEIVVYDIDAKHPYPRFKIGDGITPISNLAFSIDAVISESITFKDNVGYIDSGYIG